MIFSAYVSVLVNQPRLSLHPAEEKKKQILYANIIHLMLMQFMQTFASLLLRIPYWL